jgi:hypothetical protein
LDVAEVEDCSKIDAQILLLISGVADIRTAAKH